MRVYKKSGTKERLFEMFENVNKIKLNENFDSPKDKDEEYLDNTVGTEDSQVSKYDDGVRYPVEKKLKVKDPSLEKLKGDDAPIEEVVSSQQRTTTQDPDNPKAYSTDIKYDHPNKEWLNFRDKYQRVLLSSNYSLPRIQHFLHGIELRDEEEDFMNSYSNIMNDEAFKKKAIDDFGNWFGGVKGMFGENEKENIDGNFTSGAEVGETFQEFNEDDEPADEDDVEGGIDIDALPADDAQEDEPELSDAIGDGSFEDQIDGGLADDAEPSDFDPDQIAKGIKIEMEHTNDPQKALEIAMDHLTEMPDYYDHLEDMEAEAGEEPCCPDEESPEDSLLDPSKHWIDDYSPSNVTDEGINYDSPLTYDTSAGEAGEQDYEEMKKLKSGELEDELDAEAEKEIEKS